LTWRDRTLRGRGRRALVGIVAGTNLAGLGALAAGRKLIKLDAGKLLGGLGQVLRLCQLRRYGLGRTLFSRSARQQLEE
jgi:hypothetical protein